MLARTKISRPNKPLSPRMAKICKTGRKLGELSPSEFVAIRSMKMNSPHIPIMFLGQGRQEGELLKTHLKKLRKRGLTLGREVKSHNIFPEHTEAHPIGKPHFSRIFTNATQNHQQTPVKLGTLSTADWIKSRQREALSSKEANAIRTAIKQLQYADNAKARANAIFIKDLIQSLPAREHEQLLRELWKKFPSEKVFAEYL